MAGESLDWLPEGWTVMVKTEGGGRKKKIYIHPTNGKKFKSRPEVLRYLSGESQVPNKDEVLLRDIMAWPSMEFATKILKDELSVEDGKQVLASFQHRTNGPA